MNESDPAIEAHPSHFLNQLPAVVVELSGDGTILYANQAIEAFTGYSAQELAGRNWWVTFFPGKEAGQAQAIKASIDAGEPPARTLQLTARDGSLISLTWDSKNTYSEDGQLLKVLGVMTRIAAIQPQQPSWSLFQSSLLPVSLWHSSGRVIDANNLYLELVGFSREELLAGLVNWRRLTPVEYLPLEEEALSQMLSRQPVPPFEKEYQLRDGTRIPVLIGSTLLPGSDHMGISFVLDLRQQKRLEQQIKQDALMFERTHDGIIAIDTDMKITRWNHGAEEMYGWRAEDAQGKLILDVVRSQVSSEQFQAILQNAQELGSTRNEARHYNRKGEELIVDLTIFPLDSMNTAGGFLTTHRDITSAKRVEEALRASEARFRIALANVPITVYTTDRDLRYTWVYNPSTGFGLERSVGKRADELHHPEEIADLLAFKRSVLERGVPDRREIKIATSGEERVYDVSLEPLRSPEGELTGLTGAAYDLTEFKKLETRLAYNSSMLENVDEAIFATGPDQCITYWNHAAEVLLGLKAEQALGRSVQELLITQETKILSEKGILAINEKGIFEFTTPYLTHDGREIVVEGKIRSVSDAQLGFLGIIGIIRDVTERHNADQALRASEARERARAAELEALLDTIPSIIWISHDTECKNVTGNRASYDLLRMEAGSNPSMTAPENEVPRHFKILINGQSVDPKQLPLQRAAAFGEEVRDFIEDIIFEDGQRVHLLGNASPLYDEQRRIRGSVAAFTDLTRLEQAEAERRLIEARFRIVFESQLMPLALWRSDGQITDANEAFLKLCEFSVEELHTGQASWFDVTLPEELPRDLEAIETLRSGEPVIPYEKTLARRNGDRIPILVGFSILPGSQNEGVVFVLDLTESKQAEQTLRDYAQRLEQSNQDLQDFAFIASHDLQEPLRKVRTFSERIKNRYQSQLGAEGTDYVDRMFSATMRMQQMINDLLSYSRILTHPQPYEQVNLNNTLKEVVEDLDEQLRLTGGEVEVGELPVIEATPGQMVELFLNLVNNAVKFHRQGVPPRVVIASRDVSLGWVEIEVADNGIGFADHYKERIFRPFERLHGRSEYEGSGIGLSICRRITERHSGSITARSKPGEGSTFIVRLPVRQP